MNLIYLQRCLVILAAEQNLSCEDVSDLSKNETRVPAIRQRTLLSMLACFIARKCLLVLLVLCSRGYTPILNKHTSVSIYVVVFVTGEDSVVMQACTLYIMLVLHLAHTGLVLGISSNNKLSTFCFSCEVSDTLFIGLLGPSFCFEPTSHQFFYLKELNRLFGLSVEALKQS